MHTGVPLSFFSLRQKKTLERTFESLMVELASDILSESVELEVLFLQIYSFSQTDLSLIF